VGQAFKTELEALDSSVRLPSEIENLDWWSIRVAKAKMSLETSLPDPDPQAIEAGINLSAHLDGQDWR
jgi:hypothetical protein